MMSNFDLQLSATQTTGQLQLSPIIINDEYRKKWNISLSDFVCLTINGELVRETLYRVPRFYEPNLERVRYFMLEKQVETYYTGSAKLTESKKHYLAGRWCIIDEYGNEKIEFDTLKRPHIVKNSLIYALDDNYYNIETGALYCCTRSALESGEFLFLENRYDRDKSKRGVLKINKKDGSYEFFPE